MKMINGRFMAGSLVLFLVCIFVIPASVASAQDTSYRRDVPSMDSKAVVPLVTLRHWKDSKPNERYAFLVGFVTMLEMEKEWQMQSGKKMTPLKESLAGSWVRGFENVSLKEIYDSVNNYISSNPSDLNRPVAEVLWYNFAQPKMTEKVRAKKR